MLTASRAVSMPDDLNFEYAPPLEQAIVPSAETIAQAERKAVKG